jgi:hypothetical protein
MTRLGRNPFETQAEQTQAKPTETFTSVSSTRHQRPASFTGKIVHFLQVDLPAESFLLGLKAALLLRSVWD